MPLVEEVTHQLDFDEGSTVRTQSELREELSKYFKEPCIGLINCLIDPHSEQVFLNVLY
jgi:thiamine pyrophosphate-dependent acetolactate synthase large subunit-like protein